MAVKIVSLTPRRRIWFASLVIGVGAIFLWSSGDCANQSHRIPVTIEFRGENSGDIFLEVANPSKEIRSLRSNLSSVFDSSFLGFPTKGSIQLRNADGKSIELPLQHEDGWWWPSVLSSAVDMVKNRALKNISEIQVPTNEVQKFPIRLKDIFVLAMTHHLGGKNQVAKEFRVRFRLMVEQVSGEIITLDVVSQWLPIKDPIVVGVQTSQ